MPKLDDDTILALIRFYRSIGFSSRFTGRVLSLMGVDFEDLQRVYIRLGGV